ncbi:hypothetical protein [Novosphingobium huizhouense]|uniref:hypothetical protein n=1 Tax=Novosphingobium huizhouense TaxID=2866625 RepID=UPI001CD83986|nr:hypothetical protein [Novosphingobium huizhouense]
MTLAELLKKLPPVVWPGEVPFPPRLLGAFRRKSITFCTGETDEETQVFWFQSASFTIDLRLAAGAQTPLELRQGWTGDTRWNAARGQMAWDIARSYQPHDIWPEPADLRFIGNAVLEFAPSGAYVEDWRQLATSGPLLGLRLVERTARGTGARHVMDGGLIVAGEHMAYACSRLPDVDARLRAAGSIAAALASGAASADEVESYEVSVASGGDAVALSTQPWRIGQPLIEGPFTVEPDGSVSLHDPATGDRLCFIIDLHLPTFLFAGTSEATPAARQWIARERAHVMPHGRVVR